MLTLLGIEVRACRVIACDLTNSAVSSIKSSMISIVIVDGMLLMTVNRIVDTADCQLPQLRSSD